MHAFADETDSWHKCCPFFFTSKKLATLPRDILQKPKLGQMQLPKDLLRWLGNGEQLGMRMQGNERTASCLRDQVERNGMRAACFDT